jgi:predicted flavoprotein YhiN
MLPTPALIQENWSVLPRGNKELLSVFTKFQPGDTMEWFDHRNVPLKIENDNRTFPESSSQTIINTFLNETQRKMLYKQNAV